MRGIIIFLSCICLVGCRPIHQAVSSYDMSLLPSDFGGHSAYAVGMSEEGKPVFIDPNRAFETIVEQYKEGFQAIKEEYYLFPITKWNWRSYGYYGWQITHEDEDVVNQAYEISRYFQIYQNSF